MADLIYIDNTVENRKDSPVDREAEVIYQVASLKITQAYVTLSYHMKEDTIYSDLILVGYHSNKQKFYDNYSYPTYKSRTYHSNRSYKEFKVDDGIVDLVRNAPITIPVYNQHFYDKDGNNVPYDKEMDSLVRSKFDIEEFIGRVIG